METREIRLGEYASIPYSPEGFELFFKLTHDFLVPDHARPWVYSIFEGEQRDKGVVIVSFRGSAKSTILAAFMAYYLGHHPDTSNGIIRANEIAANESGRHISNIIAGNPGWRAFFPHVVPDDVGASHGKKGTKWTSGAYEIIDTRVPESVWRQRRAKRASPSLYALPYKSRAIMGKRITGKLLFDDIHDELNTESERELEKTKSIVDGPILNLMVGDAQDIFIGNAWLPNDIQEEKIETGEYLSMRVPAIRPDGEATWPDKFPIEWLEKRKRVIGDAKFAQFFMCDASAMSERSFTYIQYPAELVNETWVSRNGVDYSSILPGQTKTRHQTYFCIATVIQHPDGYWIVYDGVLKQVTQAEAEGIIKATQDRYPASAGTVVELDGKGEEFYASVMLRNPRLNLIGMKTGGAKKEQRWLDFLQPMLVDGSLRIATGDSYFLTMLREILTYYPNVSRNHPGKDAMDAVFWAMRPDLLSQANKRVTKRPTRRNPFFSLGKIGNKSAETGIKVLH